MYRFSIRQASEYFETGFGFFWEKNEREFINQYNELFNKKEIDAGFSREIQRLRLINKINLFRAAYNSLSTESEAEHSKEFFKQTFGKEWEYKRENYELINSKAEFFINKLQAIKPSKSEDSITFSELVAIVESSRGIAIDREIKLFEFHKIYKQELKKWQQTLSK
jgi:hypothetical protein